MHLTIARKLTFGLGSLCALSLAVGVVTFVSSDRVSHGVSEIIHVSENARVGDRMLKNALDMQGQLTEYLLTNDESVIADFRAQRDALKTGIGEGQDAFTNAERKEIIREVDGLLAGYDKAAERVISLIQERNQIVESRLNPTGKALTETINAVVSLGEAKGDAALLVHAATLTRDAFTARAEIQKFLANRKREQLEKATASMNEALRTADACVSGAPSADIRGLCERAKAQLSDYAAAFTRIGEINMERNELVQDLTSGNGAALSQAVQRLPASFQASNAATASDVSDTVGTSAVIQKAMASASAAMAAFLAFGLTRSILRPIRKVIGSAEVLATGDLTERLDDARQDELGQLAKSFNTMASSLSEVIRDVQKASGEVASAASEIAASAEQMAAGMQRQAEQTSEVSAAVSEMSASIQEVASRSSDGRTVVEKTVSEMKTIATQTEATSAAVNSLGQKSEEIGRIVSVINDIADQTNLLALNAAIEAARAGEHGRGFAVVADEVRKLAERTTDATQEIASSIRQIQAETNEAVTRMHAGAERVGSGVTLAQNAGEALAQIVAATSEQAGAASQIAGSVERINAVTTESKDGAAQAAAAATQLSANAENLQTMIGRFKVSRRHDWLQN